MNGDNLKNVTCEGSRLFRNKKKEYMKEKINELSRNGENKNIRDRYREINGFKRGQQRRNNVVEDENVDFLANSHNILSRWENYFSQLLNVLSVMLADRNVYICYSKKYKHNYVVI
jgi:hypothetical protein